MREIATFAYLMLSWSETPKIPVGVSTSLRSMLVYEKLCINQTIGTNLRHTEIKHQITRIYAKRHVTKEHMKTELRFSELIGSCKKVLQIPDVLVFAHDTALLVIRA